MATPLILLAVVLVALALLDLAALRFGADSRRRSDSGDWW